MTTTNILGLNGNENVLQTENSVHDIISFWILLILNYLKADI